MPGQILKGGVNPLRRIDLEEALEALHALIGQPVEVRAIVSGCFFGHNFTSRLEKIEALPPDDLPLILYFENGTIDLDPAETRFYLGAGGEGRDWWLELGVDRGRITVTVEPARH